MKPTVLTTAWTHNLQGVSLTLPPSCLIAVTGVSGSGKSSLCLDTLYAEGQRRFVESFSPYARQFLERHQRPPIDNLDPVPAAIAVDRRAPVKSSRSTVATMADLEPYFSGLFLHEAAPMCADCQVLASWSSPDSVAQHALSTMDGQRTIVLAPLRVSGTEDYLELRTKLIQDGYHRLWLDSSVRHVDDVPPSDVLAAGGLLGVVVDRVRVTTDSTARLREAVEAAWNVSDGLCELVSEDGERVIGSKGLVCPSCGTRFERPTPGLFSYQSPLGACPTCHGFGRVIGLDLDKVIPDPRLSLADGAIRPWTGKKSAWERRMLKRTCEEDGIDMTVPWEDLSPEHQQRVLEGDGVWTKRRYPGVFRWFKYIESKAYKMHVRVFLARYRSYDPCPTCGGKRLNDKALAYRVAGLNLAQWHQLELSDALELLKDLATTNRQGSVIQRELLDRLGYLRDVGLGYLTLDRQARTLSGGEAQRVSLTAALGASLSGALVVLDEPTVGLHVTDIPPLVRAMRALADRDNVVMVVEHDPTVVRAADRVIELGPGAGANGGKVIFEGTPTQHAAHSTPAMGRRRAGERGAMDQTSQTPSGWLHVHGARQNNLQNIDMRIPIGVMCVVSGPSGSGKSTLAEDIIYRAAARHVGVKDVPRPGAHDRIDGLDLVTGVELVNQSPLGRTSRGNAATYTKAWDRVRAKLAAEDDAKMRGFTASHFSFNVAVGRCDACSGQGYETVEMQFLADVSLLCPVCRGKRFKSEVLEVTWRGKSAADLLAMTVDEVLVFAEDDPAIGRALRPLRQLGLGYLPLGQPLSTLSGGEAQRLKLARALRGKVKGKLFLLDEPSAGLHATDVADVIAALQGLVLRGASVVVVDHDLSIVRAADWVVDLGPGGGKNGGKVVAEGTPEQVQAGEGRTAQALRAQVEQDLSKAAPSSARSQSGSLHHKIQAAHIEHAREHNLREVSVDIPLEKLVVVTGPSGSGKSSLVFDVLFSEAQRRFLETLTPYARQFLPTMPRADVDAVTALPPSIALEQRRARSGGNSTVATVSEVAHYLRLLYAKVGTPFCPSCDVPVQALSVDQVFEEITRAGTGMLLAPAVRSRKGLYKDLLTNASRAGIERARVDGRFFNTSRHVRLAKTKEHDIDLLLFEGDLATLPRTVLDDALRWGSGAVRVLSEDTERLLSTKRACPVCGHGIPEMDPRWFSFNTAQGRCDTCMGAGTIGEDILSTCPTCQGARLAPIPRAVRLHDLRYHQVVGLSVSHARRSVASWTFEGAAATVAKGAMSELIRRLAFLDDVGLGYLSLGRDAATLSGGEMQRLRLAAQLGAGLTGAMYVLDEPTIGLHPRDTSRLLRNLRGLVDTGSSVIVVEHDADTIQAADHLIDMGPAGGRGGGRIVAEGPAAEVLALDDAPTARALREHVVLVSERPAATSWIELTGARGHNLQNVSARFPARRLTVVAGISGSGKSTLVQRILYPAVRRALGLSVDISPLPFDSLVGVDAVQRAVAVDQQPIGRTPRSVPATFLGVWDHVRALFAKSPDAQVRGFNKTRFSFNSARGGRCSTCNGMGVLSHEMSFLPDVETPCTACGGARFEPSTLEVRYRGLSVGDVLRMTAREAVELFSAHKRIVRPLRTLDELGVGYVQLGQSSRTLSGGEAQRLKLALELTASSQHKPTLYVLDEPTTGLHIADVRKLVGVLHRLVDRGDTVVVIEHHPDVIAAADHVVELGPEGGEGGGRVIAQATPQKLADIDTATGVVLKDLYEKATREIWMGDS